MVKVYFDDEKGNLQFVDVSIWSLVKANFLSSLIMAIIVYGIFFAVGVLLILL